jgi:hypothetical protein
MNVRLSTLRLISIPILKMTVLFYDGSQCIGDGGRNIHESQLLARLMEATFIAVVSFHADFMQELITLGKRVILK